MSIDERFLSMMPDVVVVVGETAVDKYGKSTWTGAFGVEFGDEFGGEAYPARIQDVESVNKGESGEVSGREGIAFLYGYADVDTDSLIVLPDGSQPVVRSVSHVKDESGVHHTVVRYAK